MLIIYLDVSLGLIGTAIYKTMESLNLPTPKPDSPDPTAVAQGCSGNLLACLFSDSCSRLPFNPWCRQLEQLHMPMAEADAHHLSSHSRKCVPILLVRRPLRHLSRQKKGKEKETLPLAIESYGQVEHFPGRHTVSILTRLKVASETLFRMRAATRKPRTAVGSPPLGNSG